MGTLGHQTPERESNSRTAEEWLEAVRREERRGELLSAFDLAQRGLTEHPEDLPLKHRAVLVLARTGATDEAATRFAAYGLDRIPDEEIAALGARIAKDFALREVGQKRRQQAERAAERYAAIFRRTGGYYPAVNAGTLWLIAGQRERSRQLAERTLELLTAQDDGSYYAAATQAEAHLLLGREAAAHQALQRAAASHEGDYGALATTRRQLRLICETLEIDPGLLSPLAGPGVAFFCGHRIAAPDEPGRFTSRAEGRCAAAIAEVIENRPPGFAYGAVAGGADVLWAEALLARGCELYVVLPFALEEFIQASVAPCGPGWVTRCERVLAAATDVHYATNDAFLGDDVLFRYGGELAMGLALLRARYLDADAWGLAVWDGGPAQGEAGTAIDVATWQRTGRPTAIVSPDGGITTQRAKGPPPSMAAAPEARTVSGRRVVRAMLFGDIRGYSRLTDEQLLPFAQHVLGALAAVVEAHSRHVWYRNTWGDALYLVLTDAAAAAFCALDVQDAMAAIDLEAEGLPSHLGLRLSGHVGPVFPIRDPVLDEQGFMGSHVSRTARIEPVTPPGEVYVTEAFAAALELAGQHELACDYVGHMAAAKGYGLLRMYRLRRAAPGEPGAASP